jgi:hypothetical protein
MTRGLPPEICDPLTPGNSTVGFRHFPGGFVSPMRVALSARVSTHDQHTLALQIDAMRKFATRRGWTVTDAIEEWKRNKKVAVHPDPEPL